MGRRRQRRRRSSRRSIRKADQPKHPVVSFFWFVVEWIQERALPDDSDHDSEAPSCDDDEEIYYFGNGAFASIDEVIEFIQDTETDRDNDDAIVSSWIDNFHFLLAEQDKRQLGQASVQLNTSVSDDGTDANKDENSSSGA